MLWCWSVALAALGISGSLLVGMKLAVGWVVDIACEVLWLAYGIVTSQWGFCLSAMFFTAVYARNLRAWRTDAPTEVRERMR